MIKLTDEAVEAATRALAKTFVTNKPHAGTKDFRLDARAALEAALPHLEGATPYELESERIAWHRKEGYEAGLAARATPAIDREALQQAIQRGAVRADLAKYFQPGDMDKLVNEVLALVGGAS